MNWVDNELTLLQEGDQDHAYFAGLALAKAQDESVLALGDRSPEGILTLRHLAAWAGMDYSEQVDRIRQLSECFNIVRGAVDETGVGAPILEDLRGIISGIEGVTFTQQMKDDLASGLRSLLEQKRLTLPNDRRLIMQLNGLRYQVSKTGNLLFESPETQRIHDDMLWALACYAARAAASSYPPGSRPVVRVLER
jgi:phage FluMu gp28-like protein